MHKQSSMELSSMSLSVLWVSSCVGAGTKPAFMCNELVLAGLISFGRVLDEHKLS